MLIGSFEERDLFMNSVLTSIFGSELYLEENDSLYSLWIRSYSDLDGERHYGSSSLLERGNLRDCVEKAQRVCVVDTRALPECLGQEF